MKAQLCMGTFVTTFGGTVADGTGPNVSGVKPSGLLLTNGLKSDF